MQICLFSPEPLPGVYDMTMAAVPLPGAAVAGGAELGAMADGAEPSRPRRFMRGAQHRCCGCCCFSFSIIITVIMINN